MSNPSSNLGNNLTHSSIHNILSFTSFSSLFCWTQSIYSATFYCQICVYTKIAVGSVAHQIMTNTNQNLTQWDIKVDHFCYRMISLSPFYVDCSMQQMHSYKCVAVIIFLLKILQKHTLPTSIEGIL